MAWEIRQGDALERLREMPDESVQCCVTSPPYFGLRDYGTGEWEGGDPECGHLAGIARPDHSGLRISGRGRQPGAVASAPPMRGDCTRCGAVRVDKQLGLEATPEEYVAKVVAIFAEVRRVLRADGTCWLNLGDTYAGRANAAATVSSRADRAEILPGRRNLTGNGIKNKDLIGIPWMVAFALRAQGWWLRQEIIWHKRNGLPGGGKVVSKPDRFHEQVFLLAKSERYFYDADAIREAGATDDPRAGTRYDKPGVPNRGLDLDEDDSRVGVVGDPDNGRHKRSVWKISTYALPEAHFAAFPPALVEPCVLAGSAEGDTILDPFAGAATAGLVATRLGRDFLGIELNPEYVELGRRRILDDAPLLNMPAEVAA